MKNVKKFILWKYIVTLSMQFYITTQLFHITHSCSNYMNVYEYCTNQKTPSIRD